MIGDWFLGCLFVLACAALVLVLALTFTGVVE